MLNQEKKIENIKWHIILASKSERRKDILAREGFDFEIYVPNTEEKNIIGEKYSDELVAECAVAKAKAAYEELTEGSQEKHLREVRGDDGQMIFAPTSDEFNGANYTSANKGLTQFTHATIIVSCDTVVVNDGLIIGKPKDKNDAMKILKSLSGSRHQVISAVCICKDGEYYVKSDTTYVKFRKISDEEIENYIIERKPYDKAGSYGIQDEKFDFVEGIEGSMDNVVGFPIETFKEMLSEI